MTRGEFCSLLNLWGVIDRLGDTALPTVFATEQSNYLADVVARLESVDFIDLRDKPAVVDLREQPAVAR